MLKRFLVLAAFGAMTACAPVAPDTSADEVLVKASTTAWFDHYNNGNAEGVANLYAADGVLMPPGVPALMGRAAIQEFISADIAQSKAGGIVSNNGEFTGVGVSGDMAWLSGTFVATDASGATVDTGNYLVVLQRTAEGWMTIRDTWNSDMAPAPVVPPAEVK